METFVFCNQKFTYFELFTQLIPWFIGLLFFLFCGAFAWSIATGSPNNKGDFAPGVERFYHLHPIVMSTLTLIGLVCFIYGARSIIRSENEQNVREYKNNL